MSSSVPARNVLRLNALRAFEAAARLGGFAPAAVELSVTAGAIAAQIKGLESEYGAPLFERHAQGVRLTPLGLSVSKSFTSAFDALESAARDLRQQAAPHRVHIATSPAVAQLWLEPRLRVIAEMVGPVAISVTALDDPPNLKRSPFDICLFYTEHLEKTQSLVLDEEIEPVCTPAIAEALREPLDLLHVRCIPDVVWTDWSVWAVAKMPGLDFTANGPAFSLYSVAVRQALNGVGVLMGRKSLVQEHLDSGALVAPFDAPTPLGLVLATWMVPESRSNSVVKAVAGAIQDIARS